MEQKLEPKLSYINRRLSMQSHDLAFYLDKSPEEIIEIIESIPVTDEFKKSNLIPSDDRWSKAYTIFEEGMSLFTTFLLEKYSHVYTEEEKLDEDYVFSLENLMNELNKQFSISRETLKHAA